MTPDCVNVPPDPDVTAVLKDWSAGDRRAAEILMPFVYEELRRLARYYLRGERSDHTLQATALVHEAYLKLIDQTRVSWQNRAHFSAMAAQLMRRILINHARAHHAVKRGGGLRKLALDETRELLQKSSADLIAVDEALDCFARSFPRESQVVEMKFFGGMSAKEIAEVLKVSTKTVGRDWEFAKLWLGRELAQKQVHA